MLRQEALSIPARLRSIDPATRCAMRRKTHEVLKFGAKKHRHVVINKPGSKGGCESMNCEVSGFTWNRSE